MTPGATLSFGARQTQLAWPDGAGQALPISPAVLALAHWPQGLPTALQIERAIDTTEHAIEQAGLRHAERDVLRWALDGAGTWHDLFGSAEAVHRDALEAQFSRLAGPSNTWQGEVAATLLVLRELMHHLGFQVLQR